MKKSLLSFIVFFLCISFSYGQVTISNTAASNSLVACGAPLSFSAEFTNNSGTDIASFSRQFSLPVGYDFTWTSLPSGVTLTKLSHHELKIDIGNLADNVPVQIGYTIEAGCAVTTGTTGQVAITTQAGDNISTNTVFTIGTLTNGTLTRDLSYELVDGAPSSLWGHYAQTGEFFTRSYRLINTSAATYNGYINFNNTFQSSLQLVDVMATYNGQPEFSFGPATPVSGNFSGSVKINNLTSGNDIIITERLKVINCLDGQGNSSVKISSGCYAGEECSIFFNNQPINVLRRPGESNLTIVDNEPGFPMCFDNEPYHRTATFVNTGTAPAKNIWILMYADDIFYGGLGGSTLIPVDDFKITIYKSSGSVVYEGKTGLSPLMAGAIQNYLVSYPEKCYEGEVFTSQSNFSIAEELQPDDSMVVDWIEYNCCPQPLDITRPMDWNGSYFHTTALRTFYFEECPAERKEVAYPFTPDALSFSSFTYWCCWCENRS